jgi:F-type H+-transporting ATPase subunit delta
MSNARLAFRYAKSLVDISLENNQLDAVCEDIKYLQAVCKASKEFTQLLSSPIIKADKKESIILAVTGSNIGTITTQFIKLLLVKGRERDLFEITNAFIAQYNELKGIHIVKLTTAVAISDSIKKSIQSKFNNNGSGTVQLETSVKEDLIGGFVLEFDNKLLDFSIQRDLNDIKKQFLQNVYVSEIN